MTRDELHASGARVHSSPTADASPSPTSPIWDPRVGSWVQEGDLTPIFPRAPMGRGARRRRLSPTLAAGLAGGLIGALVATGIVAGLLLAFDNDSTVVERRLGAPTAGSGGEQSSLVDIADLARPWVVHINVTGRQQGLLGPQRVQGSGSGVILRSDGFILTNAHVVDGATDIEVTLATGEEVPARLVGTDVVTDLAVIQVDQGNLPASVIGSARDLQVGEPVLAIGSPLGLEQTVTSGIVSALGRQVPRRDMPALVDMIQTDASITRGNSGGALVDSRGSLVGINTAVAADPELGTEGIAFAIPIDIATSVADQIVETGEATHPWLGVSGANITPETARQFGIEEGALVLDVFPGSPAEAAGIEADDVIVALDGDPIESMDELVVAIRMHEVGESVTVTLIRDEERMTVETTLGERPDNP